MTSTQEGAAAHRAPGRLGVSLKASTLPPYLIVGLAWFAFLMVAFRVRTIEPVFLWVFGHGLVAAAVGMAGGFWNPRLLFLVAYLAAGIFAWFLIELGGRDPRAVWRRAVLAWLGIQVVFCATCAFLIETGVLHE